MIGRETELLGDLETAQLLQRPKRHDPPLGFFQGIEAAG